MSDASFRCPACGSNMRAHQTRLVCEHCRGVMLSDEELVASIHELDGATEPLVAVNQRPSEAACPRCAALLSSCALRIGAFELAGRHLRCSEDGVFMTSDVLVGSYARVSHRPPLGGGSFTTNVARSYMDGAASGTVAAGMRSVANAFAQRNEPSVIFGRSKRPGPRVQAVFATVFADRVLGCPACGGGALELWGDRWRCRGCAGAFIENAALAALITDISGSEWKPPAARGGAGARACPACAAAMLVETDGGVTIDRCVAHGTWFDERELEAVLLQAADPPQEPSTVGGWLRRLFRRGS